jgi:WD40 repeat protein
MACLNQVPIFELKDFPYYDKILLYVHDALVKHHMFEDAATLVRTHNLDLQQKIEIDVPESYFHLWLKQRAQTNNIPVDCCCVVNAESTSSCVDLRRTLQHLHLHDTTDGSNARVQQQDNNRAANTNVKGRGKQVLISDLTDFPFYDKIYLYVYDSMVKQNHLESAAEFARVYNIDLQQKLEIDVPDGYFHQWASRNKASLQRSVLANEKLMGSLCTDTNTSGSNASRPQQLDSNGVPASIHSVRPENLNSNAGAEEEVDNKTQITGTFFSTKPRCIGLSREKLTCCHFSSCGKFLASAGHELMVIRFDVVPSEMTKMDVEHSDIMTDVRFKPGSTQIATSSFDKTVLLWDPTKSRKSVLKLEGHGEKVMSLDFNEKDTNLLCSCDASNEIRFWNLSGDSPRCVSIFQGGNRQVRFRPQSGNLLAAASGITLNIIDVKTSQILNKFEGHTKEIKSICWDGSGSFVASVSEDNARLWCVSSGRCVHTLNVEDYFFESCIFHPLYQDVLVIASNWYIVLWSPRKMNSSGVIPAHRGVISCFAHAPYDQIVSSGHDGLLKLWKFENLGYRK